MKTIPILSTINFTEEQLQQIASVSPRLEVQQVFCEQPEEVSPLLRGIEVLLTQHGAFGLEYADRLQWIQSQSAGVDHFRGQPVIESDVILTTASGIHATPIAEYILGLMLALDRRFWRVAGYQREHRWPEHPWRELRGRELRHKTLGIVGYGSIGRELGRLGHCLGMRVLALSASGHREDRGYRLEGTGDPRGEIPAAWYRPEQLPAMLLESDYVVILTPLTSATEGWFDTEVLRAMRPSAYLINVARGEIVVQKALLQALREEWIAGAALDVFDEEPLPSDHPYYETPHLMVMPHMAGITRHYNQRLAELFCDNLGRYLQGEPLWNRVDRQRGY
jgi:phosphoglycerate dehydrogenase-like enzyme